MPLAALGTAWAAAGMLSAADAWRRRGGGTRLPLVLGGLVLALLAFQACRPVREDKRYRREFAAWLGGVLDPGTFVATNAKGEIPYYAGRRPLDFSFGLHGFMSYPKPEEMPQVVVLELDPDADDWQSLSAIEGRLDARRLALPEPWAARFAVYRRDGAIWVLEP